MKAALIVNPLSGKYKRNIISKFAVKLEKIGVVAIEYELENEQPVGEIISKLDPGVTPMIILAAGDGMINSAINALARRSDYGEFSIAIVPVGTANVLSIELGVDSIRKSLEAIEAGRTKKLHIGKITAASKGKDSSSYFSLMASAGLDSQAVRNVDEKLK
ncbi:MAG: hypothetical protein LBP39_01005, partial [Rickettsiales bacterium]|nr:hypothetical protein [Rickettsiales bacterium]